MLYTVKTLHRHCCSQMELQAIFSKSTGVVFCTVSPTPNTSLMSSIAVLNFWNRLSPFQAISGGARCACCSPWKRRCRDGGGGCWWQPNSAHRIDWLSLHRLWPTAWTSTRGLWQQNKTRSSSLQTTSRASILGNQQVRLKPCWHVFRDMLWPFLSGCIRGDGKGFQIQKGMKTKHWEPKWSWTKLTTSWMRTSTTAI